MARIRALLTGGSDGNARLTAATAVVLLVLLAAEGLTLLGGVGRFLTPHIFIGLLLIPPIGLKLASTGWRMVAYYRRAEEYVRKGPPHIVLRALVAPVLVVATIVMFASGIAAAIVGHGGLLLGLHKVSFIVWGVAFALHVLAHALKLWPLAVRDWWRGDLLGGRRLRQTLLGVSLVIGLGVALFAFPLAHGWHHDFGFKFRFRGH
ncbi:MAG TPA: hypothetical protein VFB25_10300 [Gaiellaceae bacterium]|nr:hypothetical protein [Gaiellaceae bacterium]